MEVTKKRYCKQCKEETVHRMREDALEIEYQCKKCQHHEEVIKTFF